MNGCEHCGPDRPGLVPVPVPLDGGTVMVNVCVDCAADMMNEMCSDRRRAQLPACWLEIRAREKASA